MKSKYEDILDSSVFRNAKDVDDAISSLAEADFGGIDKSIVVLVEKVCHEWGYFSKHSLGKVEE